MLFHRNFWRLVAVLLFSSPSWLARSWPMQGRLNKQPPESYKRWESSSFQPAEGAKEAERVHPCTRVDPCATHAMTASLGKAQRCLVLITAVFLYDHCEMLIGELLAGNCIGSCLLEEDQLVLVAA